MRFFNIPIFQIDNFEININKIKHAVPVAKALLDGGINVIELTLRTPVALDAARVIKKEFPEITLGFGTVLTVGQVTAVAEAGADFAVSPGCNPKIIAAARAIGLPFSPGIMTPTDIEMANYADSLIVFWDGKSKGTKNMIYLAKEVNLKVKLISFKLSVDNTLRSKYPTR